MRHGSLVHAASVSALILAAASGAAAQQVTEHCTLVPINNLATVEKRAMSRIGICWHNRTSTCESTTS